MAAGSTAGLTARLTWVNSSRASSTVKECTQQRMVCLGEVCGTKASANSGCLKFLSVFRSRRQFDLI